MAIETPPRPQAPAHDAGAGVVKDARHRQRRHRLIAAAVVAVGVAAGGLIHGFAGDGGSSARGQPSAGRNALRNDRTPRCRGTGGSTVLTGAPSAYTFSLYVTNADSGAKLATICLNGVEHGSGGFNENKHRRWPPPVAARQIQPFLTEYTSLNPRNQVGPMAVTEVGRAGTDVSSVSALLSTGQEVHATLSHGWYLVWWRPGKHGHTDKLVIATGTKMYEVPDPNGRFPTSPPRGAGKRGVTGATS